MFKSAIQFLILTMISSQLVFAGNAQAKKQQEEMYLKLKNMTRNLGKHINRAMKESPEHEADYRKMAKDLKSKKCKVGINRDLTVIYTCGSKSIKTQFLAGKDYFLLEGQKIPYSLVDNKKAYLKKGMEILKTKKPVSSFFNKVIQMIIPEAHAFPWPEAAAALLFAGVVSKLYSNKRKKRNEKSQTATAGKAWQGANDANPNEIIAKPTQAKKCSVQLYFTMRPDVVTYLTNYYNKNNLTKSDELDYKSALNHFNVHGETEGMCQPQPPGFKDPTVNLPEPEDDGGSGNDSGSSDDDHSSSSRPPQSYPIGDASAGFDIDKVKWLHTNVKSWKVTSTIQSISVSSKQICIKHSMGGKWKTGYPLGHGVKLEANPWVFVKINDQVYAATYEWLRAEIPGGQVCKLGGAPNALEALGPHIKASPLKDWTPRSGEVVGFMISGLARNATRNNLERSNIKFVTIP